MADISDNWQNAHRLTLNGLAADFGSMIEVVGDVDWYHIRLNTAANITFQMSPGWDNPGMFPILSATTIEVWMQDDAGNLQPVARNWGPYGQGSSVVWAPQVGGEVRDFFIKASAPVGQSDVGQYALHVQTTVPDVPANASTPVTLHPNAVNNGYFENADDFDWYRVELSAGAKHTFTIQRSSFNIELLDPALFGIVDRGGNSIPFEITYSQNDAASHTVEVIPDVSGIAYLVAGSEQWAGGYRLLHTVVGGSAGDGSLIGDAGRNALRGGQGADEMRGLDGADKLWGGAGNDRISGGDGRDRLWGGGGNDKLWGGRSSDDLSGGRGHDTLSGGDGRDRLKGGFGADVLRGGKEEDRFIFVSAAESRPLVRDRIVDFTRGEDVIDLSGIDAAEGRRGNQEFRFVGDDLFSGRKGEFAFRNGVAYGDVDGDRRAELVFDIEGTTRLGAGDFVF